MGSSLITGKKLFYADVVFMYSELKAAWRCAAQIQGEQYVRLGKKQKTNIAEANGGPKNGKKRIW